MQLLYYKDRIYAGHFARTTYSPATVTNKKNLEVKKKEPL